MIPHLCVMINILMKGEIAHMMKSDDNKKYNDSKKRVRRAHVK